MNSVEKIADLIVAVIAREKPDDVKLMSIGNTFGPVEIQVDEAYFDKHYEGRGVDVDEYGIKYDRHSVTTPGTALVFCLKEREVKP